MKQLLSIEFPTSSKQSIPKMTSKSAISISTKSTHVSLLGKDIGQLLKTLLATMESPTGVVTEKVRSTNRVEDQTFYILGVTNDKYQDLVNHKHQ